MDHIIAEQLEVRPFITVWRIVLLRTREYMLWEGEWTRRRLCQGKTSWGNPASDPLTPCLTIGNIVSVTVNHKFAIHYYRQFNLSLTLDDKCRYLSISTYIKSTKCALTRGIKIEISKPIQRHCPTITCACKTYESIRVPTTTQSQVIHYLPRRHTVALPLPFLSSLKRYSYRLWLWVPNLV